MKTLQEVKDEVAIKYGFSDYNEMANRQLELNDPINDEVAMLYAEYAISEIREDNKLKNQSDQ